MSQQEQYIPRARYAVVALFGRNASGNLRCYCVWCNDESPLTDASKVYGDLNAPEPLSLQTGHWGSVDTCEACDVCGISILQLSQQCEREHDEQQERWARTAAPTVAIEYGIRAELRCRVY